jgi:hypothetical protein
VDVGSFPAGDFGLSAGGIADEGDDGVVGVAGEVL